MATKLAQLVMAAALSAAGAGTLTLAASGNPDAELQARVEEAKALTADFVKQLGGSMQHEMLPGGPAAALSAAGAGTLTLAASGNPDAELQARVEEAKALTADFVKQLGGSMQREMQAGGPAAALKVCRELAPDIANELSLQKGWQVTRVGTRVRNPMLGLPDAWEQGVLQEFEQRAAQGEKFDDMIHFEVVEEPAGKSLRFMKAIGLAPQCVACHGSAGQIAEPVRAQLQTLYPHDRAVGYRPGDLRGAVSIRQPLEN
jgi:hypothetical protein